MGGQTAYNLNPDIAVPGQIADLSLDNHIVSFPAGEVIEFGRAVEVDSNGVAWKVKGAGASLAAGKFAGVTVFDLAREQQMASTGGSSGLAGYQVGEMVPVMRKGRIYGCWDGGTGSFSQGVFVTPNINHSSTTDANNIKGTFTGNATSSTVGSEIAAAPAEIVMVRDVSALVPSRGATSAGSAGPTYVCLLELNLPGA
jgi:hypothetical protein